MRLREADKRDVTLKPTGTPQDGVYTWGEGIAIRAVIRPLTGTIAAQMYGDKLSQTRLMLYEGPELLALGMGLCVEVPGEASCDYRITALEQWDHWRATLEWIKEGLRG